MKVNGDCDLGLTKQEVKDILNQYGLNFAEFMYWMRGQTVTACTGEKYDRDIGQKVRTRCFDAPHDTVFFSWDVQRFVNNQEPYD